jgi:hypothetical protein
MTSKCSSLRICDAHRKYGVPSTLLLFSWCSPEPLSFFILFSGLLTSNCKMCFKQLGSWLCWLDKLSFWRNFEEVCPFGAVYKLSCLWKFCDVCFATFIEEITLDNFGVSGFLFGRTPKYTFFLCNDDLTLCYLQDFWKYHTMCSAALR